MAFIQLCSCTTVILIGYKRIVNFMILSVKRWDAESCDHASGNTEQTRGNRPVASMERIYAVISPALKCMRCIYRVNMLHYIFYNPVTP